MLIELTIVDAQDIDHIDHLLHCEEHQQEFIERVLELLQRGLRFTPPATITLVSLEVSEEEPT